MTPGQPPRPVVRGGMTTTDRPATGGERTDVDAAFRGSATYRSLGEQELSPAEERFEMLKGFFGYQ